MYNKGDIAIKTFSTKKNTYQLSEGGGSLIPYPMDCPDCGISIYHPTGTNFIDGSDRKKTQIIEITDYDGNCVFHGTFRQLLDLCWAKGITESAIRRARNKDIEREYTHQPPF